MSPSPFNAETVEGARNRSAKVADCTLREGLQQVGVTLDAAQRMELAGALDDLGVYEIEAGTPGVSAEDAAAIKAICAAQFKAKISVLCRALASDIDHAVGLGAWGVRISYPVSRIERDAKLKGLSDEHYLERVLQVTQHARDTGAYVIFSPYDTTRADAGFLAKVVSAVAAAGTADRIRVVDTIGCAIPGGITELIGIIRAAAPDLPLEIHCHDDFGLATANTLAATVAGVEFVSTTMNGIGERSGNAATEEVALALEALYGIDTGLDLARLTSVSTLR